METNLNVYGWLLEFYKSNPIPKNGNWDEVSGEAFLRKLLSLPITEARFNTGRESLFDNASFCGVDPRSIAQRVMDIRTQLASEFVQDLKDIAEENSTLLRETLVGSLSISIESVGAPPSSTVNGTTKAPPAAEGKAPSATNPQAPGSSVAPQGASGSKAPAPDRRKPSSGKRAAAAGGDAGSGKDELVAKLNAALSKPTPIGDHPELRSPGVGGSGGTDNAATSPAISEGGAASPNVAPLMDAVSLLKRALAVDASASSAGSSQHPELVAAEPSVQLQAVQAAADASSAAHAPASQALGPAAAPEALAAVEAQLAEREAEEQQAAPQPLLPTGWGPRPLTSIAGAPADGADAAVQARQARRPYMNNIVPRSGAASKQPSIAQQLAQQQQQEA